MEVDWSERKYVSHHDMPGLWKVLILETQEVAFFGWLGRDQKCEPKENQVENSRNPHMDIIARSQR